MLCAWCHTRPVPEGGRRWCGKVCRQAAWRWRREQAAVERAEHALRLAIADPPYPGRAGLYEGHKDFAGEVDHGALLEHLQGYDGWALATDEPGLKIVVPLAHARGLDFSVGIWVRGPRPTPSRRPLRTWEAVLYHPARELVSPSPARDVLIHHAQVCSTLGDDRVVGAKPPAWSAWVFGLLAAQPGDQLDDLFPGSGAVGRAWAAFNAAAQPEDHPYVS